MIIARPILDSIRDDFARISFILRTGAYKLKSFSISNYPIFLASKQTVSIGECILERKDHDLNWNYNISFLKELIQRGIVLEDKIQDFKESYKPLDEFCCLFIITDGNASFVYIPYNL